jgi:bifunctional UDP-N-acetylglucosamine pyrophosphorylase/glucosamine-1-phosphate N-acetyltransferase
MVESHDQCRSAATVLTARVEDPTGYGRILRDDAGELIAIREQKNASQDELCVNEINVGVYCFECEALVDYIDRLQINEFTQEYYLTDLIALLRDSGHLVKAFVTRDHRQGLGVNSRLDLAEADRLLRNRINRHWMEMGVGIVDPTTTYIAASAQLGQDTTIYPFTVIEADVIVGNECSIGPFAHLRPGTRLDNRVTIGNFAEVSRSHLQQDSLMKHFSFLGDAEVGRHVNVGAGVITANYDGCRKNKTVVKDRAFIGSDAVLVAPLTVGRNAVIGAGSVVTKGEVPEDSVVFGNPARVKKG